MTPANVEHWQSMFSTIELTASCPFGKVSCLFYLSILFFSGNGVRSFSVQMSQIVTLLICTRKREITGHHINLLLGNQTTQCHAKICASSASYWRSRRNWVEMDGQVLWFQLGQLCPSPNTGRSWTLFNIFSFLNQIDQFLCHWTLKLEGYKCSLATEAKEQQKRHRKCNKERMKTQD
jgi:hypothetical protein